MKFRVTIFLIVAATALLITGCTQATVQQAENASNTEQEDAIGAETGNLTISFDYAPPGGNATKQFAVWLEDLDGNFVKTLFATRFIANGGYQARPQAIPDWVERSGLKDAGSSDFDAATGATPAPGPVAFVLNMKGPEGEVIPPGDYRFFVEGSLRWANRVVYSGVINLGGTEPVTVQGEPEFIFTDSDEQPALTAESEESGMIGPVTAVYTPAG